MYFLDDICAVIVAYNPNVIVLQKNVNSILKQISHCLIVDNGSNGYKLEKINESSVKIINLKDNKGIAYALNLGLKYCIDNGYKLMLSMDQDTVLCENCIEQLLDAVNNGADSVGINWDNRCNSDKDVEFLITSGNLVKVDALNSVNGYDSRLFIDSVDFDISLKLKDSGCKLLKVAKACAHHKIGDLDRNARFHIKYFTHNVDRYYYISRNHYYIVNKYKKTHKYFCLKKRIFFYLDLFKVFLFDKDRKKKFIIIKQGKIDSAIM